MRLNVTNVPTRSQATTNGPWPRPTSIARPHCLALALVSPRAWSLTQMSKGESHAWYDAAPRLLVTDTKLIFVPAGTSTDSHAAVPDRSVPLKHRVAALPSIASSGPLCCGLYRELSAARTCVAAVSDDIGGAG